MSPRGKAWLEAHADGRQWVEGAVVEDEVAGSEGSLSALAEGDGLTFSGWATVHGAMLETVGDHCAPELTLEQLAARLGFTAQEWRLMEADECLVPEPDEFWDCAMDLVGELDQQRERRAADADLN